MKACYCLRVFLTALGFIVASVGLPSISYGQDPLFDREWVLQTPEAMADGFEVKYVSLDLERGVKYRVEMRTIPYTGPARGFQGSGQPRIVVYQNGWDGKKLSTTTGKKGIAIQEFLAPNSGSFLFVFSRDMGGKIGNKLFKFQAKISRANANTPANSTIKYTHTLGVDPTKLRRNRYYEFLSAKMEKGKTYILTVESKDFVPVVLIRKNANTGEVWAIDKNEGNKSKARIRFRAPESMSYSIEVTAQGNIVDNRVKEITGRFRFDVTPE